MSWAAGKEDDDEEGEEDDGGTVLDGLRDDHALHFE